jgi:hypothetical protein
VGSYYVYKVRKELLSIVPGVKLILKLRLKGILTNKNKMLNINQEPASSLKSLEAHGGLFLFFEWWNS